MSKPEHIVQASIAQRLNRIAAIPALDTWIGGGILDEPRVYAARSQRHAEILDRQRIRSLISQRKRADEINPPPAHLDCPYCPSCARPCGSTEHAYGNNTGALTCGACGEQWECTRAERAQAVRADRAYEVHLEAERQRDDDARVLALLPEHLRELNRTLLERPPVEAPALEQLDMFGGGP